MNIFVSLIEFLKAIVRMCNENAGVISAILTIIAIVLSIRIGNLPYKKKLFIYHHLDNDERKNIRVNLTVINIGRTPLNIDDIYIKDGLFHTITHYKTSSETMSIYKKPLEVGESHSYSIPLKDYIRNEKQGGKHLIIVIKSGNKKFRYCSDWAMG